MVFSINQSPIMDAIKEAIAIIGEINGKVSYADLVEEKLDRALIFDMSSA